MNTSLADGLSSSQLSQALKHGLQAATKQSMDSLSLISSFSASSFTSHTNPSPAMSRVTLTHRQATASPHRCFHICLLLLPIAFASCHRNVFLLFQSHVNVTISSHALDVFELGRVRLRGTGYRGRHKTAVFCGSS